MPAYKGNEKYIFVSYAHKDSEKVIPLIENMQKTDFRIWYDEGIEVGAEWPAYIQTSLEKSTVVLVFISKNSVESQNCRNEINFALMKHKAMTVIYLEDTELKYGMGLQLNGIQSVCMFKYAKVSDFFEELIEIPLLQICREGYEHLAPAFVNESDFGQGFGHHPETFEHAPIAYEPISESALLKRVGFFLEDEEWDKADDFCEKILNYNPENAEAYFGKLMAELHVKSREDLKNCEKPFDNKNNYRKVMRFGNDQLKKEISGYIEHINIRNEKVRLEKIYHQAKSMMRSAKTEEQYRETEKLFASVSSYKDSLYLGKICLEKADTLRKNAVYNFANGKMNGEEIGNYEAAIRQFQTIAGWRDSNEKITACRNKIEEIRIRKAHLKETYNRAKNIMSSAKTEEQYEEAAKFFESVSHYNDSAKLKDDCLKQAETLRKDSIYYSAKSKMNGKEIGNYEEALEQFQTIADWLDSNEKIADCRNKIENIKIRKAREEKLYNQAKSLMHSAVTEEDYKKAAQIFDSVSAYQDSAVLATSCLEKAEEEKRRFAEEKEKCDVLFAEYKKSAQHEKNGADKIPQLQDEIDSLTEKSKKLTQSKNEWEKTEEEIRAITEQIEEIKNKISNLYHEKMNLGFFSGKRKNEIALQIQTLEQSISLLRSQETQISAKKQGYYSMSELCNEIRNVEQNINIKKQNLDALLRIRPSQVVYKELSQYRYGKILYLKDICKVGAYVKFGKYEQDNNLSNGKEDIEWLVLDVKDEKALVISKFSLDWQPYYTIPGATSTAFMTNSETVTWENSILRKWLNNNFLNAAFSEKEKMLILAATLSDNKNPEYNIDSGDVIMDKIFLLSMVEVDKYFKNTYARICKPTMFVEANGTDYFEGNYYWWLRSPCQQSGVFVDSDGSAFSQEGCASIVTDTGKYGSIRFDRLIPVRPAMWIDLNPGNKIDETDNVSESKDANSLTQS